LEITAETSNFFIYNILSDAVLIDSKIKGDSRGYFNRLLCIQELREFINFETIVNINHSFSLKKGTTRGIHLQLNDDAEEKFIYCISGEIDDYIVDLRKDSQTYLSWKRINLKANDEKLVFVPKGFGHGFQTLSENSEIIYFVTQFHSNVNECAVSFFDNRLNIELSTQVSEISEKDSNALSIEQYESLK